MTSIARLTEEGRQQSILKCFFAAYLSIFMELCV